MVTKSDVTQTQGGPEGGDMAAVSRSRDYISL